MIIIPIKWLYNWEYTLFSDKPIYWNIYWDLDIFTGIWDKGMDFFFAVLSQHQRRFLIDPRGESLEDLALCSHMGHGERRGAARSRFHEEDEVGFTSSLLRSVFPNSSKIWWDGSWIVEFSDKPRTDLIKVLVFFPSLVDSWWFF